ncbi:MAG: hypothetical protein ACYDA9_09635 [Terriglobia bacterium]
MNHPDKKIRKVRKATRDPVAEMQKAISSAMEAAGKAVKTAVPNPPDLSVMRAAARPVARPVMLTPKAALPMLRAGTGCPIAIGTLYTWIKTEKLYAVRMGARIYIPLDALNNFIKDCLAGM